MGTRNGDETPRANANLRITEKKNGSRRIQADVRRARACDGIGLLDTRDILPATGLTRRSLG